MSQQVYNSNKKLVKVAEETWASVSHEAIDRRSTIGDMLSVAWSHFSSLPDDKRERLVRQYEA